MFKEYFRELEEESIRHPFAPHPRDPTGDNFVVIYELLDEMMDFGYPQTTDYRILQEYIMQESHKMELAPKPPVAVTGAVGTCPPAPLTFKVSWRSEGIKYRKNEIFLDVVESVNLLVASNGTLLRSEIVPAHSLAAG